MKNNKVRCYVAGGWFGKNQQESLDTLESVVKDYPRLSPYFPRHDGVKLKPDELHESSLRKKVFEDNVLHIENSDLVFVSLDGRDGYYDTGTLWECGYAMSKGIPVIGYDPADLVSKDLSGIKKGLYASCPNKDSLMRSIMDFLYEGSDWNKLPVKVLFVGPDKTESQRYKNQDIVSSVIVESFGGNFRWLDDLSNISIYENVDSIFSGVDVMISVIDERHPIVSWMMGQAYSRDIPVLTYTNFDYGVNIMLLESLLYHCKGKGELSSILNQMKRGGIYSIPKFDDSQMKAI